MARMESQGGVPEHVLDAYGAPEAEIVTLTGGRTNRTMRVRAGRELVLQQLRATGGSDLLAIMENLVRVTAHLDWKHHMPAGHDGLSGLGGLGDGAGARSGSDLGETNGRGSTWWPELIPTSASKPYLVDDEGSVWRAFTYRPGRIARSHLPMASVASLAGMFGAFARVTSDLGGPDLIVTAPGFHDLGAIWDGLHAEIEQRADPTAVVDLDEHLDRLERLHGALLARIGDDGLSHVRQRVVHNDTKVSNVLLHETSSDAIAVLDLDLVMMGPIWHDVGDLIRSIAWHADDEGPRLTPQLFDTVAAAFVRGAGRTLDDAELATFAVAGPRLAFELGLRYLHDHLRAEPVLRVHGPGGHLARGLANVKLAEEMLKAYDALRSVVDDLIARR